MSVKIFVYKHSNLRWRDLECALSEFCENHHKISFTPLMNMCSVEEES